MKSTAHNGTDATAAKAAAKPVEASTTPLIDLSQPSVGQLPHQQPLTPAATQQQLQQLQLPQLMPIRPPQQAQPASVPPIGSHHQYNSQLILQPSHVAAHANSAPQPQPSVVKPTTAAAVVPQARALFDYVSKDQG